MNICDYLLEGKPGSSPALLTLQKQHNYDDLRSASGKIAALLVKSGAHKGERAVLLADNGFFWVAAYLGIVRAGLVSVPLPPKLPAEDLRYVLAVTEPQFAFSEVKYADALRGQSQTLRVVTDKPVAPDDGQDYVSLSEVSATAAGSAVTLPEINSDDLAALMFTSGSTGNPRGVMVTHRNILANTESIIQYLSLTAQDRIMAVLPFHYCFGTSLLHTHLRAGGSVVIEPRFMYPEVVLQRMRETACTGFAGVPSHFQILLRKSSFARTPFPHLRYVQQAGGQLAPAFITELRAALPDKQIFIMYGQTEATARLSYLPPSLLDRKSKSVGKGIPGVELFVLDENDEPVSPGQTGEIVARGENISPGYWRDPEETARCFRKGRLYTGDLATVDEDGFIYVVDRAKDFLKCGGRRVSCRHLENILLEQAQVLEAAVVGMPDEVLGEAALAFVVPRDPRHAPSGTELKTYCRQRLPLPLVPKDFVVLRSLPKNSSGKVLKTFLKNNQMGLSR